MSAVLEQPAKLERVGNIELRVVVGEHTPEFEERWSRRAEVIASWLLAEWRREQAQGRKVAS